jgi:hypothetical protein
MADVDVSGRRDERWGMTNDSMMIERRHPLS